jgi:integrase
MSCPWYSPGVELERPWAGGRPGHRPIDRLKAAGREVGIEGLTWQSLRTSWGTHAATRWGLTDREIMRVLRHSSPETSRRHYCEVDLANLRLLADRIRYGT